MRNETNGNQVWQWTEEKQQLEVMLAWQLLEIFNNSPALIGPLRIMASQALEELKQLKRTSPVASAAITQAWQSQIGIVDLCRRYPAGFNSIQPNQLDAQDCSDLIRLYGEFIEKAGGLRATGEPGERGDYEFQNTLKMSRRVDYGGGHGQIWNTQQEAIGRQRAKVPAGTQQTTDVHGFLISQKGGSARFEMLPRSTVNRIDRVFGLVPSADISGTTTDSIYFTERFKANTAAAMDPIFHLLPVATIVAGAHHSLLEVALSLSLNGIIDYRIGFYSTLFPRGGTQGAGDILGALRTAENHMKNRHMLIYYARGHNPGVPGVPAGCFLFEGRDHLAFRDFARATAMERLFRGVAFCPNEDEIRAVCLRQRLRLP